MKVPAPALLLAVFLPLAAQTVEIRRTPAAAEQTGTLVLDARGNRVMAESLRRAGLLVVCATSDRDPAARAFTARLARFSDDHPDRERVDFLLLDVNGDRADLLRQLAAGGGRWYGLDPSAAESRALLARLPAPPPALLVLARDGGAPAAFSGPAAPVGPDEALRALGRLLADAALTDGERRAATAAGLADLRRDLAARLRADPAAVTDEEIRRLYPVEGVIRVKGAANAMINQKVVGVGSLLDNGARVEAITGSRVTIRLGARLVVLEPEPITPRP